MKLDNCLSSYNLHYIIHIERRTKDETNTQNHNFDGADDHRNTHPGIL